MINFKQKVQNSFNAASHTYDQVAYIQKVAANLLVNFLKKCCPYFYPKTILDLGTGTGNVVNNLAKIFPYSNYILNDISENMIDLAIQKFHNVINIQTHIGDLETTNFNNHDLYISNFALQWVTNIEKTIKNLYMKSKVFAFTCLLDGTFKEFWDYINKQNSLNIKEPKYPIFSELNNFLFSLPSKKYNSYVKNFSINFKNIREFLKYLKLLGARVHNETNNINKLKKVILDDNLFSTSYNIMFVVLIKE